METATENNTQDTIEQIEKTLFPMRLEINLLPETKELIRNAQALAASGGSITIETPEQYAIAAEQMRKVKGLGKEIEAARKVQLKPIDDLRDQTQEFYQRYLKPLAATEAVIKRGMIAFDDEQERQRRLAAARAEEEARKAREALEAKAEKMEDKGKVEQAEALRENAATVTAAPVVAVVPQKVEGVAKKMNYSARVVDIKALCKAVLDGVVPPNAVIADDKVMNAMAKAMKEHFNWPGCELVKEASISARSSKPF